MMKVYAGTKVLLAKPMNRLEYNQYRGWQVPDDENPQDEGYLVEYVDGEYSNHEKHKGYISWSPKGVFERVYKQSETHLDRMKIEHEELKNKINKLDSFMGTEAFSELAQEKKKLMKKQFIAMESYFDALTERISLENE